MNREEVSNYIMENYPCNTDFPWEKHPNYQVFRHMDGKKWFAIIMTISKDKLIETSKELIDIMNVKCDSMLIGSLRMEQGFFPAYHMNKEHWITVALDGSVAEEKIKMLLDMSFSSTLSKKKKKR